jgi:hypothetical protein
LAGSTDPSGDQIFWKNHVEMLDKHVGISDTCCMTNNAMLVPSGRGQRPAPSAPRGVPGGVVYDTLGMPMSLRAAKAMSKGQIQSALGRSLAKLHHAPIASISATSLMDSIEVVFLLGRYYKELDRKAPDLSKIDRARWSTLEGVADVLHATTGPLT